MPSRCRHPTTLLTANGALPTIGPWVRAVKVRKPLLVLGKRSFVRSKYFAQLQRALDGCEVVGSEPVSEPPSIAFVRAFATCTRGRSVDGVIGVGGGSVMDVAKLAAVLLACEDGAVDGYVLGSTPFRKRLPLALVPTTAGTGSEVTPYASLETDDGRKITVTHARLFADV